MARPHLGSNDRGPIAATYVELQRLPAIRKALRRAENLPAEARTACAYAQAHELLLANMAELVRLATTQLRVGALQHVVEKWIWLEALSNLAIEIAPRFRAALDGASITGGLSLLEVGSRAALTFADAKLEFDQLAHMSFWPRQTEALRRSHTSGHNYDKLTVFLQAAKNVNHDSLALIGTPCIVAIPDYDEVIGGRFLRQAGESSEYRMEDTFFLQFLVLHQVPEILGDRASNLMIDAAARIRNGDYISSASMLDDVVDLVDCVILSLTPLKQLMIPVDYYKIRENLGLTSGSHSETIHDNLLNRSFRSLSDAVAFATPKSSGRAYVATKVRRLAHRLAHWRVQHLTFPRNLLGGSGTRSLVGAYGLEAAESMLDTFVHSIEQSAAGRRGEPALTHPTAKMLSDLRAFDSELLKLTSDVVQSRFQNVQNRTPPFDGRARRYRPEEGGD